MNTDNYVGVDNLLPEKGGKTVSMYVPERGTFTRFNTGDILIGNIRPYLKKIWLSDIIGGTNGDVLAIRITDSSVLPKYLYYLLSAEDFFSYAVKHSKGAKMPRGKKEAIMKYRIRIPSLEVQREIVAVLDKFNSLISDFKIGLPAEIEARRTQYEYYRDKLLSFKEGE